jgi:hypothetical protein
VAIVIVVFRERVEMIVTRIEKVAPVIEFVIVIMIGAVIESAKGTGIWIGAEIRIVNVSMSATATASVIVIVDGMIVETDGMTGRDLLVMIVNVIAIEMHRVERTTAEMTGGTTEEMKVVRRMDVRRRTSTSVIAGIARETIIARTSRGRKTIISSITMTENLRMGRRLANRSILSEIMR